MTTLSILDTDSFFSDDKEDVDVGEVGVVSLQDFLDEMEFFLLESSSRLDLDFVSELFDVDEVVVVVAAVSPILPRFEAFQLGVFFFQAENEQDFKSPDS